MAGITSPLTLSPAPSNRGSARRSNAHANALASSSGSAQRQSSRDGFDVTASYLRSLEDGKNPHPIAAIMALVELIEASTASTASGLARELMEGRKVLVNTQASLGVRAGCQLWERFFAVSGGGEDFPAYKRSLIQQGRSFCAVTAPQCRQKIADLAVGFVRDDCVILTHSYSRTVMRTLLLAHKNNKRIRVYVTEARPGCLGLRTHEMLTAAGIPCTVVLDSAVAYVMERVDMVLVGSEAVVESGGLVSSVGTYQVALVAKSMQKPFYALAESYKFLRHYPLSQVDLPIPSSTDRPSVPLEFSSALPAPTSLSAVKEQEFGTQGTLPALGGLSRPSSSTPQSRSAQPPSEPSTPSPHPPFSGPAGVTNYSGDGSKRIEMTREMVVNNPMVDVTTPDLIDFIITDLGAPLSPMSVSQYLVAQFSS